MYRSSIPAAVGGASISIAERNIDDNEVILRIGEQRNLNVIVTLRDQSYTEANIIKIFETFDLGEMSVAPLQFRNGKQI